jgi:hypothetical protein
MASGSDGIKQSAYIKANIGRPVNTIPNLSSSRPNNYDGPNRANAIVEIKKQVTNCNFLGNALKIIGQRMAEER